MSAKPKKESSGLFQGVFLAYTILLLHILVIAGVGILVLFFRGIVDYLIWAMLGFTGLLIFTGVFLYRRIKFHGQALKETLSSPEFNGRNIEVNILGGIASVKMGSHEASSSHSKLLPPPVQLLEDPKTVRIRELNELAKLLEKNLITIEEYKMAKKDLFNP
jgi:hypothetical protein